MMCAVVECPSHWGQGSRKKLRADPTGVEDLLRLIAEKFGIVCRRVQYSDEDVGGEYVDLEDGSWESFLVQAVRRIRIVDSTQERDIQERATSVVGGHEASQQDFSFRRVHGGSEGGGHIGEEDDCDDGRSSESDETEDFEGRGVKKVGGGLVKAFVLDNSALYEDEECQAKREEEEREVVGDSVRVRIRKMLELGLHKDTGVLHACLSVHVSACPPACLSARLPACLCAFFPACACVCMTTGLPACLLASLYVCRCVCFSACLSACLSVCLCICLPAGLPRFVHACLSPPLSPSLPHSLSLSHTHNVRTRCSRSSARHNQDIHKAKTLREHML